MFLVLAAACFLLDVGSKYLVFAWVERNDGPVILIPGILDFTAQLNQGAMWSFFHEWEASANTFLLSMSSLALVAIGSWVCFGLPAHDRWSFVFVGVIFGGAMGNVYDRIVFGGVRDFIHVHYYDVYHYPTFNLADSFLLCGLAGLFLMSWLSRPVEVSGEVAAASSQGPAS